MVRHTHTAEMCPGGIIRPDNLVLIKLKAQINKAGVKLIEGYVDGAGHEMFLILEADNVSKLNTALKQLRFRGSNNISPVMNFSDAMAWISKIEIPK
ncbi:DUF3303 domain-containing protein [Thermoproteota archaeon]